MKKPQLFLLHFAGGNCYSYKDMSLFLNDFEVISLELPGRGRRIGETLLKDFDEAANDFYNQIISRLTTDRFAIYGHSMGAILALKITGLLEAAEKLPVCLFVSGNPGPGIKENRKRYLMSSEDFLQELKIMGGLPELFLENKELVDFFEPILRADFQVAEESHGKINTGINIPVIAMMGTEEEYVEEISNWAAFTSSVFNYEIMEGDHFFILQHYKRIAGIIKSNFNLYDLSLSKPRV